MKNRNAVRILAISLLCCILTACQANVPYEVVLKPTNTPDATVQVPVNMPEITPETQDESAEATAEPKKEEEAVQTAESAEEMPQATATPAATPTPTPAVSPLPTPNQQANMHYFVQRESDAVQELFAHIYDAVLQHQKKIELPKNAKREHVERVMWLLINDCPELFWFSHISEYTMTEAEPDIILNVTADYLMSREEAENAIGKIDKIVDKWIEKTSGKSDYEKELYVHNAILDGCRYANASGHDGTAYGALVLGKARCQGYANALCYVLRRMGISCAVITGTATNSQGTESHAWDVMKIDGTWTVTDPTWNDPTGRDSIQYAYFNVSGSLINNNHTADSLYSRYDLPSCSSMKQNYCVKTGCYVKEGEDVKEAVTKWAADYLTDSKASRAICFETRAQYDEAMAAFSECMQAAADQTGKLPEGGAFSYLMEPLMNYLQFE